MALSLFVSGVRQDFDTNVKIFMPRREQIRRKTNKDERVYTFTYLDDSPERQEAIQFFKTSRSTSGLFQGTGLFPALKIPEVVDRMSLHAAQEYLDAHPVQEQWSLLTIRQDDGAITDADLIRLRYLPELEHLNVFSSRITDLGVRHFCFLERLKHLVLYSPGVTDACLDSIVNIQTLVSLDMQRASRVSRAAFFAAVRRLPAICDAYPPSVNPQP